MQSVHVQCSAEGPHFGSFVAVAAGTRQPHRSIKSCKSVIISLTQRKHNSEKGSMGSGHSSLVAMLLCWPPTWHAVRVVIILSLNTEGGSKTQQLWRHTNHPSVQCTLIIYYETSLVRSSPKNVCTNNRTTLDWNWMNTDLNLRSPRRWYSWISALLSSSESFFRQNTKTGYTGHNIKLEGNMIW